MHHVLFPCIRLPISCTEIVLMQKKVWSVAAAVFSRNQYVPSDSSRQRDDVYMFCLCCLYAYIYLDQLQ